MEDTVKRKDAIVRDDGNILIMSVVIVALLVATGISYMQWASDERWDSEYERATIQAYFVAQTGLIQQGLTFLRTRQPTDLPQGTVILDPGEVKDVGYFYKNRVERATGMDNGNVFQRTDTYDLYSTGRVKFFGTKYNRGRIEDVWVERTATMRARLRSFANYMYLTDKEVTKYGEIIWFWTPDTLWGRTHSNDFIGLKYSPTFFGPVSTSQPHFIYYQPQNIYFKYPPVFNAPPVNFPHTAKTLRAGATTQISDNHGRMMTWIRFEGNSGVSIFQYPMGAAPAESLILHLAPPHWAGIFVDGQLRVEGSVSGQVTVGSSQDMWLVNDVKFTDAGAHGEFVEANEQSLLGLVSEANVIIADNNPNGKANSQGAGPNGPMAQSSIILDAGIVALGESFTFEHQNDTWEAYQGPTPDERGWIYLKGAVTQLRRGYVHRSNHQNTGYGKSYHYDFRFDRRPPPFYLEALDENGHGLFDIISWGEQRPTR